MLLINLATVMDPPAGIPRDGWSEDVQQWKRDPQPHHVLFRVQPAEPRFPSRPASKFSVDKQHQGFEALDDTTTHPISGREDKMTNLFSCHDQSRILICRLQHQSPAERARPFDAELDKLIDSQIDSTWRLHISMTSSISSTIVRLSID